MTLTTEETEQITVDVLTGKPPRVQGPEADKLRAALEKDIALAKKKGWIIELPFEIPDFGDVKKNEDDDRWEYYTEETEESPYYEVHRKKDNIHQVFVFDAWEWRDV